MSQISKYQGYVEKCIKQLDFLLETCPSDSEDVRVVNTVLDSAKTKIYDFVNEVSRYKPNISAEDVGKMVLIWVQSDVTHVKRLVCTFDFNREYPREISDLEIGRRIYLGLKALTEGFSSFD